MMVDYIAGRAMPLPHYVGKIDNQFAFKRAMNHIALMTRRGVGNVMIANQEGYRQLNDSWKVWSSRGVRMIRLPLDDREPFALLGYDGKNQYDTGVLIGLRVDDDEFGVMKSQLGQGENTKEKWRDFINNKMTVVRPVFGEGKHERFSTSAYWRRLV
jgi:hypothetical protein